MSELRDAIGKAIHDPERGWWTPDMDADHAAATAGAVLAMPELQAIRKALYLMAVKIAEEFGGDPVDSLREGEAFDWYRCVGEWSLPPSVVAWALGGERE